MTNRTPTASERAARTHRPLGSDGDCQRPGCPQCHVIAAEIRSAERAAAAKAWREAAEAVDPLEAWCPSCPAGPGKGCHPRPSHLHPARWRAALRARAEAEERGS